MCGLVDCLVFDGRETAEPSLASSAVVGALDPGDDGQAHLLAGVPALVVQDVLLEQGEEGLHGGVVAAGPGPAHGSGQAVAAQRAEERGGPELTLPLSEWATAVPAGERSAMALRSAATASDAVIRESME